MIRERGTNKEFGARPLRRAIENLIEDQLSEKLLMGEFHGKDTINVDVKEENGEKKLVFEGSTTMAITQEPALVGAGGNEAKPSGITKGEKWSVSEGGK